MLAIPVEVPGRGRCVAHGRMLGNNWIDVLDRAASATPLDWTRAGQWATVLRIRLFLKPGFFALRGWTTLGNIPFPDPAAVANPRALMYAGDHVEEATIHDPALGRVRPATDEEKCSLPRLVIVSLDILEEKVVELIRTGRIAVT